jgi:hypothetical protein
MAWTLPIAYGANDDSGVLLSLAMGGGSASDVLLTTLAPTFGLALMKLYEWAPGVPWYGLSLGIGNAVGVGLMLHAMRLGRLPFALRLLTIVAVSVLILDAWYWWTFTKVMLLLQLAAFLQILRWQVEKNSEAFPTFWVLAALIGGYGFRCHFFMYTVAFAWPIMLSLDRRTIKPLGVVAAAFGLFFAADYALYANLRSDADYREYAQFHEVRYKFHDLPEGFPNPHTPTALAGVGWEMDDFKFYRSLWGIYDRELFHPESITTFLEENAKGKRLDETVRDPLQSPWVQVIVKSATDNLGFLAVVLLPWAMLGFALLRNSATNRVRSLLAILGLGGLFLYLFVNRLPMRVGEPVMLYLTAVLTLLAGKFAFARGGFGLHPAVVVIQAALCLAYAAKFREWSAVYEAANRSFGEFVGDLEASTAQRVVIPLDPKVGFTPEANHPLRAEKQFDRNMIVVPCGTKVNSPLYKRFLAKHGFASGRDLLRQALDSDRVLFFGYRDEPDTEPLWLSYLNRRIAPDGKKYKFQALVSIGEMSLSKLVEERNP